jgi:hypothetical protein
MQRQKKDIAEVTRKITQNHNPHTGVNRVESPATDEALTRLTIKRPSTTGAFS